MYAISVNPNTRLAMAEKHTAYVETLAHMNCGRCEGYWGLSNLSVDTVDERVLYCPHCGHEASVGDVVEGAESDP